MPSVCVLEKRSLSREMAAAAAKSYQKLVRRMLHQSFSDATKCSKSQSDREKEEVVFVRECAKGDGEGHLTTLRVRSKLLHCAVDVRAQRQRLARQWRRISVRYCKHSLQRRNVDSLRRWVIRRGRVDGA